jgi:hypothetical protein
MDKMFALDQKVDQNAARPRIRKHKMSDLKPLPPDDLAELEKKRGPNSMTFLSADGQPL